MANLLIQDAFEPYYAGRDAAAEKGERASRNSTAQHKQTKDGEIVLSKSPSAIAMVRRDKRAIAH